MFENFSDKSVLWSNVELNYIHVVKSKFNIFKYTVFLVKYFCTLINVWWIYFSEKLNGSYL